jgi:hypothetical protein
VLLWLSFFDSIVFYLDLWAYCSLPDSGVAWGRDSFEALLFFVHFREVRIKNIKQTCIVLSLLLASVTVHAEPLDVKTGLWEVTTTTAISGMPPIDTSKMSPEQKARFEAAMKARQAHGPRSHVSKSCITKERLEREPFQGKNDDSCTHTVISSTRAHWEATLQCSKPRRVGKFNVEAVSRERIKGTMQMNASDDKHAMAVSMSLDGKWIGSSCGKVN